MRVLILTFFVGAAFAYPSEINHPISTKSAEFLKAIQPALESGEPRGQIQLVNEFVDMAIHEVSMLMKENQMDPMDLPDLYEKIKYTIIITYWGDLNLTQGNLEGVSTLKRNKDVTFDYTDRKLSIDIPIGFDTFLFSYHYKVKIMGLGPRGSVKGWGEDIKIRVKVIVDFEKLHITLKDFEIVNIGKIRVKFDGNVLVDWLINLITGVVTRLFRGLISWVLENVLKVILNSVIDQINDALAGLIPSTLMALPEFSRSLMQC